MQGSISQKNILDDFLNPKYFQVPKDLTKKYNLNLHERFSLFEDQSERVYPYDNLYNFDKQ